ncbi:poly(glycerol-phosphate) alpha-glucosyltransferase [Lacticaseibacillus paracasei]|uniref:poly(glycerol-phosphate) alpha-glucosyltransferase n=1 Tax=Lacticaseibacillus paracasei TaxID=1597 RepID=UPI0015FE1F08|nr:poly(glycerol-phosphate) alpha-glucosyltransferase [Lacticaseibacillus paracasei]MBB1169108.1 poly(glycerol-phosphate) alpha-glucosyltransferase [Lacticaseibacillus paracasei]
MIYFVNEYVMALNSGVEHAEFKRLAVFKHAKTSAKILTRDYNYSLHRMAAGARMSMVRTKIVRFCRMRMVVA